MWRHSAGIILFAGPIQYLGSSIKQSIGQYLPPILYKGINTRFGSVLPGDKCSLCKV